MLKHNALQVCIKSNDIKINSSNLLIKKGTINEVSNINKIKNIFYRFNCNFDHLFFSICEYSPILKS